MSDSHRKSQRRARGGAAPAPANAGQPLAAKPAAKNFSVRTWLLLAAIVVPALGIWGYLQSVQRTLQRGMGPDGKRTAAAAGRTESAGTAAERKNESGARGASAAPAAAPGASAANLAGQPAAERRRSWDQRAVAGDKIWVTQEKQCATWCEIDNPEADGWSSEAFSSSVMKQFDKLKKLLTHAEHLDAAGFEFITAADVQIGALRPTELKTTFQDAVFHVQRAVLAAGANEPVARILAVDALGEGSPAGNEMPALATGRDAVVTAFQSLLSPFTSADKIRMKIKVFSVEPLPDGQTITRQTLEAYGPTAAGEAEINSIWEARWRVEQGEPHLVSLQAKTFETAERRGPLTYADCTASLLNGSPRFAGQLLKGYNHWLERKQFNMYYGGLGTPGVALGDVNNDGLEDLYLCQEDGLPNLLYLQQADGTLREATEGSGADWLVESRSAVLVDLNNDGNTDLAVAAVGGVIVAEGNGQGQFTPRTVLDSQDDAMTLSAADYDLDGFLDLYVGVYMQTELKDQGFDIPLASQAFLVYDANNGGENSLWRSNLHQGKWEYVDVTAEVGLAENNHRFTLATAWEDVDNDGDLDLYVANDFGKNNFYRNDLDSQNRRRFVDVAELAGGEDANFGMSIAWGDYDHDGWMDAYISNMFSYAGNRVMYQSQFKPGMSPQILEQFRRTAKGNTLLKNLGVSESSGDGKFVRFEDRSIPAAVNRGRWAWGARFVDINNDSWDDLVVANGFITTEDTGDL